MSGAAVGGGVLASRVPIQCLLCKFPEAAPGWLGQRFWSVRGGTLGGRRWGTALQGVLD